MKDSHKLTLFVTGLSVLFAVTTHLLRTYSGLLLTLEVIVLPVIYIIGYEIMIEKQRFMYEQNIRDIEKDLHKLEKENQLLRGNKNETRRKV